MTNVEIVGNVHELKGEINPMVEYAKALTITTPESYRSAAEKKLDIQAIRKKIDARFDPNIKKAHEAHKEAVSLKRSFTDLLDRALSYINPKLVEWDREQKRIAAKAQAVALEKQRKLDEDAEAKAKKLIKNGQVEKAQAVMETIPQVPVKAPMPTKVEGLSYRDHWTAEVTDSKKVPRLFLIPDMKALDAQAKATKGKGKIPGVRFVNNPIAIGRTR